MTSLLAKNTLLSIPLVFVLGCVVNARILEPNTKYESLIWSEPKNKNVSSHHSFFREARREVQNLRMLKSGWEWKTPKAGAGSSRSGSSIVSGSGSSHNGGSGSSSSIARPESSNNAGSGSSSTADSGSNRITGSGKSKTADLGSINVVGSASHRNAESDWFKQRRVVDSQTSTQPLNRDRLNLVDRYGTIRYPEEQPEVRKRSPFCMMRCLNHRFLLPAQCHSIC